MEGALEVCRIVDIESHVLACSCSNSVDRYLPACQEEYRPSLMCAMTISYSHTFLKHIIEDGFFPLPDQ